MWPYLFAIRIAVAANPTMMLPAPGGGYTSFQHSNTRCMAQVVKRQNFGVAFGRFPGFFPNRQQGFLACKGARLSLMSPVVPTSRFCYRHFCVSKLFPAWACPHFGVSKGSKMLKKLSATTFCRSLVATPMIALACFTLNEILLKGFAPPECQRSYKRCETCFFKLKLVSRRIVNPSPQPSSFVLLRRQSKGQPYQRPCLLQACLAHGQCPEAWPG
jgi:hypothetical protein